MVKVVQHYWDYSPENDATNKHLRQTVRGCLDQRTNSHDRCSQQDRLLPTEPFTNSEGNDGTEEAADIIDRSDC